MKRATPVPVPVAGGPGLRGPVREVPTATCRPESRSTPGDVAWMLTASALVLLMTPGLSFFYGGMVGFKNVVSTMLQSVMALGVISLLWVAGRLQPGLRRQHRRADRQSADVLHVRRRGRGDPPGRSRATIPLMVFALFQLKFAIITPALITGSFAERVRFSAYLLFMVLFSLLIYCAAGALDVAPRRVPPQVGRAGLRRRHGGPHVGGLRGAGRGDDPGPAQEPPGQGAAHRRPTCRSCCSARACSGSAGSASTPARPWRPTARPRWRSRPPTRPRRRRCWAGCSSTGCAATSRRRWAPASARWSAWWRSPRRPASSRSARASSSAWSPASSATWPCTARPSRRSTTRSTSSPATASAAWSA